MSMFRSKTLDNRSPSQRPLSPPSSPTLSATKLAEGEENFDAEANTVALGLAVDPADVLTDRVHGWKDFVVSLSNHFNRIYEAEKALARSHTSNQKLWTQQAPLRDRAFVEESAIRALVQVFKTDATILAGQHSTVERSLENQTTKALEGIQRTLKSKLNILIREQKARNEERVRDKQSIIKAKEDLQKALSFARRPGTDAKKYGDPWLVNKVLKNKLDHAKAKHEARNQSLIDTKADFKVFEANLIRELKVALIGVSSISEIQSHKVEHSGDIEAALAGLDAEKEWKLFCTSKLDKSTGPEMFETDQYEGHDDPLIGLVHEGLLTRKTKDIFQTYKEFYYVVSSGGYMHEFKTKAHTERLETLEPERSIYLGNCTLGALGVQDRKPEEFFLTETKEDGNIFDRSSQVYKFLGTSLAQSQQFHAAISSVAKHTVAIVATGSTNAVAGRTNSYGEEVTSDTEKGEVKRVDTAS
ncbi:hypothetical protein BCR33DRAFT_764584 [Rhizoclosmatium globosum]|uniref:PH domain-containing protein n=1 Tax=Rhizoclosmatium globosum TaxID=329046 RepID=A0A1Y2CIX3_9FUNG|nr:hypothetical protein BCR33DRAFT_764584 [Rhizoclosmatium globosum]|eukprot:ORY46906.1 hypothetical protein BCR33DRAFT_764584 [Rhizoclosmatium globosum]